MVHNVFQIDKSIGGFVMATKSTNIRIDEKTKAAATALFAHFGLGLSDAVNMFLRVSIEEQGLPFPLTRKRTSTTRTPEERRAALGELLEFAKHNPVLPKDYTFSREECYDRKVFHR
jgi:DNA-damage-inducible protein J